MGEWADGLRAIAAKAHAAQKREEYEGYAAELVRTVLAMPSEAESTRGRQDGEGERVSDDDDIVWVAEPALHRPPHSMAHHEPGRNDPEYGEMTACLYVHEWVRMRRDVAELFTRPCQICSAKRRRIAATTSDAADRMGRA